jgi:hypothetical protein
MGSAVCLRLLPGAIAIIAISGWLPLFGCKKENQGRVIATSKKDPLFGVALETGIARHLQNHVVILEGDYIGEDAKADPAYVIQYKKPRWTRREYPVTEADRLNGITRQGDLVFIASAFRYFGYRPYSGGYGSDPVRTGWNAWITTEGRDDKGEIACFDCVLRNGEVEVSLKGFSENLKNLRPVQVRSGITLAEFEKEMSAKTGAGRP